MFGSTVQEKQVTSTPRMLHGVFNELFNCPRLVGTFDLLSARAEGESSLFLFNPDVSYTAIEFNGE